MKALLFGPGFLGTRAPFFMDVVSIIVLLLPFLIYGAIVLAKKGLHTKHELVQKVLFVISVAVLIFFEIGVRMEGGYQNLMQGSSVSHNYLLYVLVFHIFISVVTLMLWIYTLLSARRYVRYKSLPGVYSTAHKRDGYRTFWGIVLTMLTGAWVYALLFIF